MINEIEVNNPFADFGHCEYIELRGDPGTDAPDNYFVLEVEGDGAGRGLIDWVYDVGGVAFGSNGLITFSGPDAEQPCGERDYARGGATYIQDGTISFEMEPFPS